MTQVPCNYKGPNGERCDDNAEHDGLCYWHSSKTKTDSDLAERLEKRARSGKAMVGFNLRRANLSGIDLVNHGHSQGFKLQHCDLYRCQLDRAHLFQLDLSSSSLMKANVSHSNLNRANLSHCNLLGVMLDGAKLDNVQWHDSVYQEQLALRAKPGSDEQQDFFEQAEEIYRNLRRTMESQGLFENAGYFFKREMVVRRYQLPRFSLKRIYSKIVDLFCGYGEEPMRVVAFSLVIIFSFALLYFCAGVNDGDTLIKISPSAGLRHNLEQFLHMLYFSVVTFTTLGYGDLSPVGITRAFAAIEAFIGSFTLALFVVVFVKKMTR
ncbi:ion channel [Agaribacterium haliotis]|uniref:ion channel n=1 Tax=Agaribacterium haliotis TaxID=2013869 RepID=UPI000BB55EEB|nr:ion channel [Agaribacterium haliotis]